MKRWIHSATNINAGGGTGRRERYYLCESDGTPIVNLDTYCKYSFDSKEPAEDFLKEIRTLKKNIKILE